ncbi:MAG: hypothetical protein GYA20_05635 [Chloroflexi bacterium]|nr:hypothetical protein [Chloroflexota bacterium]
MNPSKRWRLALVILAAAVAAFVFADFHLAKSNTNTSSNRTSAHTAVPDDYQPGNMLLYIAAGDDNTLSQALAQAVFDHAGTSGYFSPVLLANTPQADQFPSVLVSASGEKFLWTPVYSQSTLKIKLVFSNFRAVDSIDSGPETIIFPAQNDSPAIEGSSQAEQVDQSFGLISLPGYRRLITRSAAKSVVENLIEIVKLD